MKRSVYLIILGAFFAAPLLRAQRAAVYQGQVRVVNQSVSRSDDNRLTIAMDVVLQANMELSSNRAATLTPLLQGGGNVKALPAIVVYGRRRALVNERNHTVPQDAYTVLRRKRGEEQRVGYLMQLPYEAWMKNARLLMDADLCGCGNVVEAENLDPISTLCIERSPIEPYIAYLAPRAEAVKVRSVEGKAYLDFPVNKTVIYPDYRRNQTELAKIRATIDTIRADKNVSITGITLHGYASPEGGYANNERLAKGRVEALRAYVQKLYDFPQDVMSTRSTPEDWEGFRRFVENSGMEKKGQVLEAMDQTDKTLDIKERRIARILGAEAYAFLLKECYPALRHSDYTVAYTVRGFNVDETRELIKTHPQLLSLQEIFNLAQACEPGGEEYNNAFRVAVSLFPDDPTANLNAAAMELARGGNTEEAKRYLAKADASLAETQNNLGVVALLEGRYDEAETCFERAEAAGVNEAHNREQLAKQRNFPE